MKIVQIWDLVKTKFSVRKKTCSKKIFFLVAAGGLFYLDLNFECNRRRSDLSQRNIGTSRNWSKMSTSELILFEPQWIQSHMVQKLDLENFRPKTPLKKFRRFAAKKQQYQNLYGGARLSGKFTTLLYRFSELVDTLPTLGFLRKRMENAKKKINSKQKTNSKKKTYPKKKEKTKSRSM